MATEQNLRQIVGALEVDAKAASRRESMLAGKLQSVSQARRPLFALLLNETKKVNDIRKAHLNMCKANIGSRPSDHNGASGRAQPIMQKRGVQMGS